MHEFSKVSSSLFLVFRTSLFILLLAFTQLAWAQDSIAWALQGKTQHLSNIQEIAIMKNGDAVFCGGHDSLITFGDFAFRGPKHTRSSGATRTSAYIGRIAPDKTIRWVKQIATGTAGIYVHDLEIDEEENIYISASSSGNIRFSDGTMMSQPSTGMLVAKTNSQGDLIWGRAYDGLGTKVHSYHVLPRSDGKCYVLGGHGSGTFGPSTLPMGGEGQFSQFLGLVDEMGNPLWAESIGGSKGQITATDMAYDQNGDVLVCGNYRYMDVPNIIDESTAPDGEPIPIDTKMSSGDVGATISTIKTSRGSVQAFIGRYDKSNGRSKEVRVYGNGKMTNATAIITDKKGNIYVGLSLYNSTDLKVGGTLIPAHSGTTMALAKLNPEMRCLWYKSFDSPGADFIDDLSLDGKYVYAATMIDGCKLKVDEVNYSASGMWGGAVLKMRNSDGYVEHLEHWETGRAICVAFKDGNGYAGGWFHYSMTLAGEYFEVGQHGQFNAILIHMGSTEREEEVDSIPVEADTLLASITETQHRLVVRKGDITVRLWDDQEVDGDIISLKLNEDWVLREHKLTARPKVLKLKLNPGESNFIEMLALSLGRIPPATVAISITDGVRSYQVSLRSSPEINGQIQIVWEP